MLFNQKRPKEKEKAKDQEPGPSTLTAKSAGNSPSPSTPFEEEEEEDDEMGVIYETIQSAGRQINQIANLKKQKLQQPSTTIPNTYLVNKMENIQNDVDEIKAKLSEIDSMKTILEELKKKSL